MAAALAAVLGGLAVTSGGCATDHSGLTPPGVLVVPYDTADGDVLWAIAPPTNESGTDLVDPMRVGDQLAATVTEVNGLQAVPLNRTIRAMRAIELQRVANPRDAQKLASAVGADGVLVTSITAYDPYDPPVFGITLALFGRPGSLQARPDLLSHPRLFQMQATDARLEEMTGHGDEPEAVAALHLDARSHDVMLRLEDYARGRTEAESALGWRIHVADMDLYTKFASFAAVGALIDQEWLRAAEQSVQTTNASGLGQ